MSNTFHVPRFRSKNPGVLAKLWEFHDDHPLPPPLNAVGRSALYWARRGRHALRRTNRDLGPVPRDRLLQPNDFRPLLPDEAASWFASVHRANEFVYRNDGAWRPHPLAYYAGTGIPIEEIALRIPGYLGAYDATGETVYLDRAEAAGVYLLRERVLPDGHVFLQGHTAIDFTYPLVGSALLALWLRDRSREEYLDAARRIGDRLVPYQIAGSYNHALMPCRLLAPLYRYTGEAAYLRAAAKRAFRVGVAFQLPAGHWPGYNVWPWYQGVILRGLIDTYAAIPFTTEMVAKKDRLAGTITAGLNRLVVAQREDGSLKPDRGNWKGFASWQDEVVQFDGTQFEHSPLDAGYPGHGAYVIDALVTAHELLGTDAVLPTLHGYASFLARTDRLWRLEFNTGAAGRYLGFLHRLSQRQASPPAVETSGRHAVLA